MMREFGIVGASIWQSRKFRSLASDAARLVYFYLHTTRHGSSAGVFVLPPEMAALDMRIPAESVRASFEDLQRVGLIRYDRDEEIIQIRAFYKFNKISSRKHLQGPLRIIHALPVSPVRDFAAADLVVELVDRAADWQEKVRRYRNSQTKADQADAVKIEEAIAGLHQEAVDLVRGFHLENTLQSQDLGLSAQQLERIAIALLIPLSYTPIDTPTDIKDTEKDTEKTTTKTTDKTKTTTTDKTTERESEGEGGESAISDSQLGSGPKSRPIPPDLEATIRSMQQAANPGKSA